ncbi:AraC family transcriptional regulator [Chitinophaga niabensis]|uniref:Helix-turn-helix domain-containing protein n=1 Tax=Chitinophaga niabensis TaxID=536979 RepID=A0A1N6FNG3_9BACT|nr:helix-turn-helix domain-containing protein [Chitinophaga niabensis]SIN96740.1 Helix-turn-helix domain-containing protein [Chitinophaga niabensis]
MKRTPNIRSLYLPVQPGPEHPAEGVGYQEILPDVRLQDYIYCYWQLKTRYPLTSPFHYRVIADGCMDVYFELEEPDKSYVMGFTNSFVEFELAKTFNYVGVRFFPSMFPQLYKISAAGLSNRAECLENVLPAVAKFLADSFSADLSPENLKALLDEHFLRHVSNIRIDADSRLYESIERILQNGGTMSVEKELPQGISVRQLRRLFEFYIGDTPKEFSRVVRFQKTLQAPEDYLNAGYYDQAHFIKEFKHLYGLTPGKALLK